MSLDDLVFEYKRLKIILPDALGSIMHEIEKSKEVLEKNKNDESIWKIAIKFLEIYSRHIYGKYERTLTTPRIFGGSRNSTDLLFRTKTKNIMRVNFSNENEKITAHYFGQEYGGKNGIKGQTKINKIHEPLMVWMKKYLRG